MVPAGRVGAQLDRAGAQSRGLFKIAAQRKAGRQIGQHVWIIRIGPQCFSGRFFKAFELSTMKMGQKQRVLAGCVQRIQSDRPLCGLQRAIKGRGDLRKLNPPRSSSP